MIRRSISTGFGLIGLLLICSFVNSNSAAAASIAPQSGVTISPALVQLSLSSKQTSYGFTAYAANDSDHSVSFSFSPLNFVAQGVTGGIAFQGNKVSNVTNPHGLASYISLSPTSMVLGPHSSQPFQVQLTHTNLLSPGGHYAAVLLYVGSGPGNSSTNHVSINQVLSMLVFTATSGSGTQNYGLAKPNLGIAWLHMPQTLNLFVSDNGNTQVTPRGYLTIWSSSHKPLSRMLLNSGSALVLPGSTRLFETTVGVKHQPFWPGLYNLQIAYNAGGASKLSYYNIRFLYVGRAMILILVVIIILLVLLLFRYKAKSAKYRLKL